MKTESTRNALDFLFPKDEGRHVDALHEWWYLNSHLETKTGRRYGLFVSFASPNMMYLVLVDKSEPYVVKHVVRKATVRASRSCLNLVSSNNWWRQVSGRPFRYVMHLDEGDLSLSMELLSRKPPLFVNNSGHIKMGLLGSSKYYALTNMCASGMLRLKENEFEVNGIGWMDRQWGSWDMRGISRWNWFSIQLSNNVEILAAQCFHPFTGNEMMKFLNIMDSKGKTSVFNEVRVECLKSWRSPRTDSIYGVGWTISLPQKTNLQITPALDEQELYKGFWEGCCEVKGILKGQHVEGVSYVEQIDFRHPSSIFRLISLGTAAFDYIGQQVFGRRVDFKLWNFAYERLNRLFRSKKQVRSNR